MTRQRQFIWIMPLLLSIFSSQAALMDNPCNNNDTIKEAISNINELWQHYDYSYLAVEIYSGTTINTKPLTCEYIVGLNTRKKLRIRYQVSKEVYGQEIITVDTIGKVK